MAAQTAKVSKTFTLSGATADTVAFSASGNSLAITNHAGVNVSFRIDGTTAVADADETYLVLPGTTFVLNQGRFGAGSPLVSIVGNGNKITAAIF